MRTIAAILQAAPASTMPQLPAAATALRWCRGFSHGDIADIQRQAKPQHSGPEEDASARAHVEALRDEERVQQAQGYAQGKAPTEQEAAAQTGEGVAGMTGNLYSREGERYESKARQEATGEEPVGVYDEQRTGGAERARQQAQEAEALVGEAGPAGGQDTGT